MSPLKMIGMMGRFQTVPYFQFIRLKLRTTETWLGAHKAVVSSDTDQMKKKLQLLLIPIQKVNEAYDRLVKTDVKYRFVIDMASLKKE